MPSNTGKIMILTMFPFNYPLGWCKFYSSCKAAVDYHKVNQRMIAIVAVVTDVLSLLEKVCVSPPLCIYLLTYSMFSTPTRKIHNMCLVLMSQGQQ